MSPFFKTILIFSVLSTVTIFAHPTDDLNASTYIIGGNDAKVGHYPFVASLIPTETNTSACTATILTKNWLLTAATCCQSLGNDFQVFTGSVDLDKPGKLTENEKIVLHPFFNINEQKSSYLPNDVCLVKLAKSLVFNNKTAAVTLPPGDFKFPELSSNVTILGWGYKGTYPIDHQRLQEYTDFTVTPETCQPNDNFKGKMCVKNNGIGYSGCNRDEGGPLIFNEYIQMGVFSYFHDINCETSRLSSFSTTSNFVAWIIGVLGDDAADLNIASYEQLPCKFTCLLCCDYTDWGRKPFF